MTAPTFVAASTGATDATGNWAATCHAPGAAGRIIVLQILQDGATAGAVALTGATNIENLAGTDNAWTSIGAFAVGASTEARQHLWIGRSLSTSAPTASGTNSTSEDLYWRFYEFQDVNTGTTLASVIENGSAGATVNSAGTSATAADASVQTLGTDRLALNFVAVNDDNAIAQFSGMSGGTWVEVAEYAESSGTDGAIQLQYAAMATAGTIDGGTASITDSDAWGVVGFALIPGAASTNAPAENAAGTGLASNAGTALAIPAGNAAATGLASDATVVAGPLVPAENAAGTGAATNAATSIAPVALNAAAIGAVTDAAANVAPSAVAAGAALNQRLAPDAITYQAGYSGSLTDIQDDPDSPDGNWLIQTEENADFITTFPTPMGSPAGSQEIRVLVNNTGASETTLYVYLLDDGVLVDSEAPVIQPGQSVVSFVWDAAVLTNPTGATVALQAASIGTYINIGAVEWNAVSQAAIGVAQDATTSVAPNAAAAAATGLASDAAARLAVSAGSAAGTGVASDATVSTAVATNAAAEAATGTGAAYGASTSVAAVAAAATASGTAFDATVTTNADAQAASATGIAYDGSVTIAVGATAASASGAANDATVSTSSAVNAPAELASASAAASDAAVALAVAPSAATATGTALDATINAVTVTYANAGLASATAAAYDATVIASGVAVSGHAGRRAMPLALGLNRVQRDDEDVLMAVM